MRKEYLASWRKATATLVIHCSTAKTPDSRPNCFETVAGLANAGAQETSVILHTYLAARQKVCDRCHRFFAASRAGTDCQDQITERKPSAGFHDLAKLAIPFHMLTISALSRSNATSHCEYFLHRNGWFIQSLFTLELTEWRHFCSILKHA